MVGTRPGAGQQAADEASGRLTGPRRLPGWLVMLIPAAAELVVGGYRIAGPSLWRDEAATISGSQRPVAAIMRLIGHQDAVHGLYYLMTHEVIAAGGISGTVLRLPSLVAMCLAAGLTALLALLLATRSGLPAPGAIGLLAGLALVAVPLTTRYAQEARPYAITSLFAVLASYLLVRAAGSGRRWWWGGYAAALTLTGLFNLFAVLLALAHGVSLLAARAVRPHVLAGQADGASGDASQTETASLRRWLAACVVTAILLTPLAVLSLRQSGQLSWVTRPDPSTVATLIRDFAGATVAIPFIALLAVLGALAGPGMRRAQGLTLATVAVPWLVLPPVVLLAVSLADPLYVERYVVFCLPALSLLAGAGLVWLVRLTSQAADRRGLMPRWPGSLAAAPSALLVAVILAALVSPQRAIRLPSSRADNLRALAATLRARERPGDAILYLPWDTSVIRMAYPGPFEKLRDIGLGVSPVASATLRGTPARPGAVAARLRTVARVWTIQWTPSQPAVRSSGASRTSLLAADGFRLVHRWRIASVFLSLYMAG